jgi:cytoplasmic iron level regulating protein YaaA (DUF328/UPF0246 family)
MNTIVRTFTAAAVLVALAGPAYAYWCPRLITEIDNALSTASTLTAAQLEEVTRLRDEGAALHKAGQHSQALATLNEARALLK